MEKTDENIYPVLMQSWANLMLLRGKFQDPQHNEILAAVTGKIYELVPLFAPQSTPEGLGEGTLEVKEDQ